MLKNKTNHHHRYYQSSTSTLTDDESDEYTTTSYDGKRKAALANSETSAIDDSSIDGPHHHHDSPRRVSYCNQHQENNNLFYFMYLKRMCAFVSCRHASASPSSTSHAPIRRPHSVSSLDSSTTATENITVPYQCRVRPIRKLAEDFAPLDESETELDERFDDEDEDKSVRGLKSCFVRSHRHLGAFVC